MTPTVTQERWDDHYKGVSPKRENGNPWRYVDQHELDAITTHTAPHTRGAYALDVGCGTGDLTAGLRRLGYTALGIDIAPTAIDRARTLHPETRFLHGDPLDLALSPAAYTLITLRLTFPFLPDHEAFLTRAQQLLSPGGQLLVIDYLATDPPAQAHGIGLTNNHLALLDAWSARIDEYTTEGLRGFVCTPNKEA